MISLLDRNQEAQRIVLSLRPLLLEGYSPTPGASRRELGTSAKTSFRDIVTVYDRRVEDALLEKLTLSFPGEAIIGEESTSSLKIHPRDQAQGKHGFWLLDPIDGTTNFSRSYPFFCCTIAFVERTPSGLQVQTAVTYNPVSGELFHAARTHGAWLGRERLHVSAVDNPQEALLTTGFASLRSTEDHKSFHLFKSLTEQTLGVRRDGSAALDLAYVAAGRIDSYWEWGLSAWDIAAGTLLVQEAGGFVTRHDGTSLDLFEGEILSSNSRLHKWLIHKIKEQQ
ncbi:MAG: inositol monophosphatase family protein [Bdellovibrionota bacterium]